jgi:hypothetical protein
MPEESITLDELGAAFESLAKLASRHAAIGIADAEVAQYARAVEYGSVAGQRPWPSPGPRTTLAVDPEGGEQVVVALAAPHGFVRMNTGAIAGALTEELQAPADWLDGEAVAQHLGDVVRRAALRSLERLRQAAPRDTGRLAESLQIADAE